MLKDKLFVGLIVFLLILVLVKQCFPSKLIITDSSKIENAILLKLDSINKKEYVINLQKQDITSLENQINSIQKNIKLLNEKLKKDTAFINTYSDSAIDKYLRSRYHY